MPPYFQHVRRSPSGSVGRIVRESWTLRAERCRTAVEAALPDHGVELYFNLGPSGRHLGAAEHSTPRRPRAAWVVGPRDRPLLIEKEIRDSDIVGIRLHPGTAMLVLGVPAAEVRGSMIDLDLFWGGEVEDVRDQLSTTTDLAARLAIVEAAVARRSTRSAERRDAPVVTSLMAGALCDVIATLPHDSIASLAARAGLTHRQLIAVFDEHVGLKPKAFQRVDRLRRVFGMVNKMPHAAWTVIAHQSGYYDQAHMINDFRALTGVGPADYAARRTSVGEGFMPYRLAPGL